MEVAHSAEVINNLTKNFVVRENHFVENLEKLQGHLSALLLKQKPPSPENVGIDAAVETEPSKQSLSLPHVRSQVNSPTPAIDEQQPKAKAKRKSRKHKQRTL